jgi:Fe-S oxidoreductase
LNKKESEFWLYCIESNLPLLPLFRFTLASEFITNRSNYHNKLQLLNSYSCTECGRCTSVCPANITGKKLSPRKIMMDTRDRIEEVGKNIDMNKDVFVPDGKSLLNDYISKEELWACTSCNACVEECPISIDPLSIILDMRRYLVMEESSAPLELNNMMSNIENNGAPWPYNQMDRLNWKE